MDTPVSVLLDEENTNLRLKLDISNAKLSAISVRIPIYEAIIASLREENLQLKSESRISETSKFLFFLSFSLFYW